MRSGHPGKLTTRAEHPVVQNALTILCSGSTLAEYLASTTNITVIPKKIRNVLHHTGLKGRRPLKNHSSVKLTGKKTEISIDLQE